MLTQLELRVISRLYTAGCKHCMAPFTWTGERMILKPKLSFFGRVWNWFTFVIIPFSILFELKQMHAMIGRRELNGTVLNGTLIVAQLGHLSCKLNTLQYQSELVHVNNQVLQMNSNWGTHL